MRSFRSCRPWTIEIRRPRLVRSSSTSCRACRGCSSSTSKLVSTSLGGRISNQTSVTQSGWASGATGAPPRRPRVIEPRPEQPVDQDRVATGVAVLGDHCRRLAWPVGGDHLGYRLVAHVGLVSHHDQGTVDLRQPGYRVEAGTSERGEAPPPTPGSPPHPPPSGRPVPAPHRRGRPVPPRSPRSPTGAPDAGRDRATSPRPHLSNCLGRPSRLDPPPARTSAATVTSNQGEGSDIALVVRPLTMDPSLPASGEERPVARSVAHLDHLGEDGMATSAGVSAPMSSPIGPWIRSIASGSNPAA